MSISTTHRAIPAPLVAKVSDDSLTVELADGRVLSVPLQWFPR